MSDERNRTTAGDTILGLRKIRRNLASTSDASVIEAAIEELISRRTQKTFDDDRIRRLTEALTRGANV